MFSAANVLSIVGETESFRNWLESQYSDPVNDDLLAGYIFFMQASTNGLIGSILLDSSFGLEEDQDLRSAVSKGMDIGDLPDSCEKTVAIRNIWIACKNLRQNDSWDEVSSACRVLIESVKPFLDVYKKHCTFGLALEKDTILNVSTRLYVDRILGDTREGYPQAWKYSSITNIRMTPILMERCLLGYTLSLEYIWKELLGEERFLSSFVKEMHNCRLIYESRAKELLPILREFEPIDSEYSESECEIDLHWLALDEFSNRICREIVVPDQIKLGIPEHRQVTIIVEESGKQYLKSLIINNNWTPKYLNGSDWDSVKKRLQHLFQGHHVRVVNTGPQFGFEKTPTFWALLLGAVQLWSDAENEIAVQVRVFKHPIENSDEFHYSYCILIGQGGPLVDGSGWQIFLDATTSGSDGIKGTSGMIMDSLIESYEKKGYLELKTDEISLEYLTRYIETVRNVTVSEERGITIADASEIIESTRSALVHAKGKLFEYVVHKSLLKSAQYEWTDVDTELDGQQIDALGVKGDSIDIFECKIDVHEHAARIITQLRKKKDALEKGGEYVTVNLCLAVYYEVSDQRKEQFQKAGIRVVDDYRSKIKQGKSGLEGSEKERLTQILDDFSENVVDEM